YTSKSTENLESGDLFVLGTDGIWEATDSENEMFGKKRLKEIIRTNCQGKASEIVSAVFEAVMSFASGEPRQDDATLIVVKIC
ncbi:MAG: PP2C family protein-serine/threonine phosphatase, partial [Desulfobacterales bacterium]